MADHELMFKVGDEVRVTKDQFDYGHRTPIGTVLVVVEVVKESREGDAPCDYQEYFCSNNKWFAEDELELT